ncbi:MAG: hypothetical protein EBS30_12010, partial [Planctomycetes bacterium]|nr:hypothetical protein [Planctomycetota bacterium]
MSIPFSIRIGAGAALMGAMAFLMVPAQLPAQGFRPAMPPRPAPPGPLRPPITIGSITSLGGQGGVGGGQQGGG